MSEVVTTNVAERFAPTAIDAAAAEFIKSMEAEVHSEAIKEPDASPPVEAAPVVPASPGEGTPPPAPVAADPPKDSPEDPGVKRGLDRLVAREVELRTREDSLKSRETRLAEIEGRFKDLEARQMPDDLTGAIRTSPGATLRAMGLDPDHVVRVYLAEKMGDKAPPELKEVVYRSEQDRKIAGLERQLTEYQRAQAGQAYVARIQAGAREYANNMGDSPETPTVARVAKANVERVTSEIMDEISKDAREAIASRVQRDALPFAEAARRVEARWSDFAKILSPQASTTTAPASTKAAEPTPIAVPKPKVNKPLAPWQQGPDDVAESGLKEAMAEYRKVEQALAHKA